MVQRCKVYKSARAPVRFVFDVVPTARTRTSIDSAASVGTGSQTLPDFKLNARPGHSPWRGPDADVVQLMFKTGDDLRQDQFVCQVRNIFAFANA